MRSLLRRPRHTAIIRPPFGQLAQLVEQRIENPRVRGSIPRLATKNFKGLAERLSPLLLATITET